MTEAVVAEDVERGRKWLDLLEVWRGSGKSLSGFAREREVSYWALQHWRRKSEGMTAKSSNAKAAASKEPVLKLIPLDRGAVGPTGSGVVVRLAGDIAVEVKAGCDVATLAAVVSALRAVARC
jgi:hypothetical protein